MSELEELKKALERLEDELFELNIRSMIDYIEYGFLICDGEPMGMCEGTVDCLELKDCKDKKVHCRSSYTW